MNRSDRTTEELLTLVQRRYATGFPNPQRAGCPAPEVLQSLVQSARLPDDVLHDHVFSCSECFNEYRTAILAQREASQSPAPLRWWNVWELWRRPLWIAASAVLLLTVGLLLWRARPATSELSQTPLPVASPTLVMAESKLSGTSPTASLTPPTIEHPLPVAAEQLLALHRDLNDYHSLGAQRRGGDESETPITLPRTHLRLRLTLPANSVAGGYRVSLLDTAERRLVVTHAHSRDGQTLEVRLDVRRIAGSKARLRIERAGQSDVAPNDYEIRLLQP